MIGDQEYYINKYVPKKYRPYITDWFKDENGWWVYLDVDAPCHFDDMIGSGSQISQMENTLSEIVKIVKKSLRDGYPDDIYRR